jgi:hypothetical protein
MHGQKTGTMIIRHETSEMIDCGCMVDICYKNLQLKRKVT